MDVVLQEAEMVVVVQVEMVEISEILEIRVQADLRMEIRQGTGVVDQHRFQPKGRCRSMFSCRFARIENGLRGIES